MSRRHGRAPAQTQAPPQGAALAGANLGAAAGGVAGGDNAFTASQLGLGSGQAAAAAGDAAANPTPPVLDVQGQGSEMTQEYQNAHALDTIRQVSVADDANAAGTDALRSGQAPLRETGLGEGHSSPVPGDVLPFNQAGGWDAVTILAHAGQFDLLMGTDSDANRCVQAVALSAHILDGPDAVLAYIDGSIRRAPPRPTARQSAACAVLQRVRARIAARTATYGDLSWVQEAAHDMTLGDEVGTGVDDILGEIGVGNQAITPMSAWASTADEAAALATGLQAGEKLIVTTWEVIFNSHLDLHDVRAGQSAVDHRGEHAHRIRRLRGVNQAKPPHEQIDEARDSVHGHQMLMFSTGGAVQLYDPEVSRSGLHTAPVGGQDLARYFRDDPGESTYHYIEVLGRIAGPRPAANGQPAAAAPGSGGTS